MSRARTTTTTRGARPRRSLIRGGIALAATVGVAFGAAAPAGAQQLPTGSLSPEGIINAAQGGLTNFTPELASQILGSTGSPDSSDFSLMAIASRLGFSPNLFAGTSPLPPAPNPDIKDTRVVGKDVTGRYEVWHIASARMQRIVDVEVWRAPAGAGRAPSLYLLDGVGSEKPSGFMQWGAKEQFDKQNVNLIIPTGGQASMWADWQQPDPVLGISKWESFITQDLPAMVEGQIDSNGKRGIGGISMGAAAALSMAARHPDLYQGVFGVSGCYATSGLGEIMTKYTVGSRGASTVNMWGEPGSQDWVDHDVLARAEALRGKSVYLSAATGVAAPGDWNNYHQDIGNFVAGMALEQASNQCTYQADQTFRAAGVTARIDHLPVGMHNWSYFSKQIPVAWESIRGALY